MTDDDRDMTTRRIQVGGEPHIPQPGAGCGADAACGGCGRGDAFGEDDGADFLCPDCNMTCPDCCLACCDCCAYDDSDLAGLDDLSDLESIEYNFNDRIFVIRDPKARLRTVGSCFDLNTGQVHCAEVHTIATGGGVSYELPAVGRFGCVVRRQARTYVEPTDPPGADA